MTGRTVSLSGSMALGGLRIAINARSRANLSMPHLTGAAGFARELARIEEEHKGEPLGDFYEGLRANATAVVMMAVASVEAYINGLFADAETHFDQAAMAVWQRDAKKIDRKPLLKKADRFLELRGKEPLGPDGRGVDDVRALIDLRNELVHFHPEWTDEAQRHETVSRSLKSRFQPPTWLAHEPGLFPLAWACHSCGEWAIVSSVNYIDELTERAALPSPTTVYRDRLVTQI